MLFRGLRTASICPVSPLGGLYVGFSPDRTKHATAPTCSRSAAAYALESLDKATLLACLGFLKAATDNRIFALLPCWSYRLALFSSGRGLTRSTPSQPRLLLPRFGYEDKHLGKLSGEACSGGLQRKRREPPGLVHVETGRGRRLALSHEPTLANDRFAHSSIGTG